jgi:tetratricopeptide (TPR) repeat protein
MAKPMLVSVPFALLLLDFWPLARWKRGALRGLVLEKLPLLALSVAACVVALAAQSAGGASASLAEVPLGERVSNAVVAYAVYLRNTVWPDALAVFYPDAASVGATVPIEHVFAACAVLLAITTLVLWQFRRRPYLAFGWAWYLGTLVPVIGLVQVGSQASADRYTYVPLIGIFVALVWWVGEVLTQLRCKPALAGVAGALVLAPLSIVSATQVGYWRDNTTLFRRALAVTERNWLAWNSLGNEQLEHGDLDRALASFEEALRILPGYADAAYNSGLVHLQRLDRERACALFSKAVALDPQHLDAWNGLGVAQMNLGRYGEALQSFDAALRIDAVYAITLTNIALTHTLRGDRAGFEDFERRLRAVDAARADELIKQARALQR